MSTIKVTILDVSGDEQDILIAQLSELGFEGFEQNDSSVLAYITELNYNEYEVQQVIAEKPITTELVPQQNWNALWESNFEPVLVDDFCLIRADFHDIRAAVAHEIVITPKMSFGTGHHATTQQMIKAMRLVDMSGKRVFDFGTGTGVLAILAEKLGAIDILAIDNDEWSVENTEENIARNNCSKIKVALSQTETLPQYVADVILANINRHVLLAYMPQLYATTASNGVLLLSGILVEDESIIRASAEAEGFKYSATTEQNKWLCMSFFKA